MPDRVAELDGCPWEPRAPPSREGEVGMQGSRDGPFYHGILHLHRGHSGMDGTADPKERR